MELERHRAEDTDVLRALMAQQGEHHQALQREEERGYERGGRDLSKLVRETAGELRATIAACAKRAGTGNDDCPTCERIASIAAGIEHVVGAAPDVGGPR